MSKRTLCVFLGVTALFVALSGVAAWHIASNIRVAGLMRAGGSSEVQGPNDIYNYIQGMLQGRNPIRVDNTGGSGSFFIDADGRTIFASIPNRLAFTPEDLSAMDYVHGTGFAQNPSRVIGFQGENGTYVISQGHGLVHIVPLGEDGITSATTIHLNSDILPLRDIDVVQMMLAEDRLIIIMSQHLIPDGEVPNQHNTVEQIEEFGFSQAIPLEPSFTALQVYDISSPEQPALLEEFGITGTYLGARLFGNNLYLATSYGVYDLDTISREDLSTFMPYVTRGEEKSLVEYTNVHISPCGEWGSPTYMHVMGFDVADEPRLVSQMAILDNVTGTTSALTGLLLAVRDFSVGFFDEEATGTGSTHLAKISFEEGEVSLSQSAEIPFQYGSISTYMGMFFLVPGAIFNDYGASWTPGLPVEGVAIDQELSVVGHVNTNMTIDEIMPSTFIGPYLYLIHEAVEEGSASYALIDFSSPNNVTFKPQVYAPFFLSSAIFPWNLSLGHSDGREQSSYWLMVEEEFDERSRRTGISLMMLDQSDPLALNVAHSTLYEDRFPSDVMHDSSLVFMDYEAGILALPFDEDYLVFNYSPDDGFELIGEIELSVDLRTWDYVQSLIADDQLIIVQLGETFYISTHSLDDLSKLSQLTLR